MPFTSPARPRWGDVYLASGARGISVCGDILAATALALTFQSAGHGGVSVAVLMLAASLPAVGLAPLAGRLADRVDSRLLLVAAGLGQAGVCSALAFVDRPVVVIALVAVLATGLAVTQPTLAALLPEMVGREHLARASAINQSAGSIGLLAGPALAGLLVGQFGLRLPLLLDAASYLAIAAAGLLIYTRRGGRGGAVVPSSRGAADGAASWRLWHDPLLRSTMVSLAAVVGAIGAINVVAVFFVRETLGASTTVYGLVEASWTGGMLAGAWVMALAARRVRDDAGLATGVLVQLGAASAAVALTAAVGAPAWLVPLWLVGGAFNGGLNVFENLLMVSRVPAEHRGRGFAVLGGVVTGVGLTGYVVGGFLVDHVSPRLLVAVLGLAGVAVVLALVPAVSRTVRRERERAAATAPLDTLAPAR